jgi:septum site-determining protein MinD
MNSVVSELKKEHDFILIDSPAGIEQGFQNAVAAASEAIVVATPEMSSVRDADRIIGLLETKEEIKNYKLVLNRVRPDMIKANDMMDVDDVLEILSVKLLGIIPEDQDIIISTNRGEPVVLREGEKVPKATLAYRNIAKRISGEDVPFLELETPVPWMEKVKSLFKFGAA